MDLIMLDINMGMWYNVCRIYKSDVTKWRTLHSTYLENAFK